MRLFALFAAILVAGTFAQDLEEESEPSLCVEHKNPFKYAHCIKKRDTACQNGGFCGSCNENSCQSCNGNSCKTSCNGSGCNQCPTGNCCDGQNCNACSGRSCCNGASCNNCVNSCSAGCSTVACRSSCFQTCQGSSCCDRSECFNSCRAQCFGDHCYEGCFKQCPCQQNCNNPTPGPVIAPTYIYPNYSVPDAPPPQTANQTIIVVNKPENKNPVNITTIVNLKNYISNKNYINTPINVTNIIHNHINESQAPTESKPENVLQKCCIVVYPVHCYDIPEAPYKKCVQKRERKCGEICSSPVVHVVHIPGKDREIPVPVPYPVPGPVVPQPQPYPIPVVQRYPVPVYVPYGTAGGGCGTTGTTTTGGCGAGGYKQICHYINRYPWISCSHYGVQNCGNCYVCGGQYNPGYCSQQVSCAGLCRGGLVNFGNNWQSDILRFYNSQYAAQSPPIPHPQAAAAAQPADLQQQAVQQPAELQQPGLGYVQQPADFQQGGQQFVVQQPYDIQQPFGGQQYGMQQPYMQQVVQQPEYAQQPLGHAQQQPAQFAGK